MTGDISEKKQGYYVDVIKPPRSRFIQPAELSPLMELAGREHALSDSIDRVVSGATQFGKRIKPLLDEVNRLGEQGMERAEHNPQMFRAIYGFLKGRDMSDIEFDRDDIVFLLSTPVGEVLRRPLIHNIYADKAQREVDPGSDIGMRVKDKALMIIRMSGWSKFVQNEESRRYIREHHKDEGILMDVAKESKEFSSQMANEGKYDLLGKTVDGFIREDLVQSTEAMGRLLDHGKKFYNTNSMKLPSGWLYMDRFYSDAGHAFSQVMDIRAMLNHAEHRLYKKRGKGRLRLRERSTLMVVEDNEIHRFFLSRMEDTKNMIPYGKPYDFKKRVMDHEEFEASRGFYPSAEKAIKAVEDTVARGGKPPDFLITDIELAGEKNGMELIREVHEKYPETTLFMVYSSNLEKYKRETGGGLDRLMEEDWVIGGWNKRDFTYEAAVNVMNAKIEDKRSKTLTGRVKNFWDRMVDRLTGSNKSSRPYSEMISDDTGLGE